MQDFHVLSSVFEDRATVNTSHVINHLSFGTDYPGALSSESSPDTWHIKDGQRIRQI